MLRPILSEAPVNALLHPDRGEVRICGPLKPLVNFQGNVLVKFGYEKQFERAEETACYQGEIDTPGTPSTQRTPSPSPQAKRPRTPSPSPQAKRPRMCGILFEPTEDLNS